MDERQLVELGHRFEEAFNTADWAAYAAPLTEATLYESPRVNARVNGHVDLPLGGHEISR
jgi:hypothetical protein